ncbi:MAG TPA: hypothetical protein VGD43_24970, partial [Micromonospora sp.]
WFLVGAVAGADGATRPVAWTSADGAGWTPLVPTPRSPYGVENVLYAAGCRDGRLAAVGAKSGGVHGNPRVSSWRQTADRSLVEVPAEFELFGGPRAVNVGRVAGGPAGWLIAGNRVAGAAVWTSPDAGGFRLLEGTPGLATDATGRTWAYDVTAPSSGGWLVVGSLTRTGRTDSDPVTWTSTDGATWRRDVLADTPESEDLQRVARLDGRTAALGLRGDGFGVWIGGPDGWQRAGGFRPASVTGALSVSSLTAAPGWLVAAVAAGAEHSLWASADQGRSWRPVAAPVDTPAGGDRAVAVAAAGARLLLLVDDGRSSQLFWAPLPQ